jgi:glycosyltransferase involved in cell wall biosynthesis
MEAASSGYSYVVSRLSDSLRRRGIWSSIATVGGISAFKEADDIRAFECSGVLGKFGRSSGLRRWLEGSVRSGEANMIHAHSLWTYSNLYAESVARLTGCPFIVSPHGTLSSAALNSGSPLKKPLWHLVQRRVLVNAACLHATADSELQDIRAQGLFGPVAVIPNGVDLPDWIPPVPRERRTILFLGRVHPIKQPDVLLRAWSRLESLYPAWDLDVAGIDRDSPGHLDAMRSLARTLGLRRVRFLGEVVGESKWAAYRSADLYVLPSKSENFAITVAEALAAGTPAVVTTGAPWPTIEARGAGWWIDISTDSLTQALRVAMETPREQLARMGWVGRQWMESSFGWNGIAMRFEEMYRWVLMGCIYSERPDFVDVSPTSSRPTSR